MSLPPEKLWGGRFSMPTDNFVEQFTQSVSYDQRLYHYDIKVSIAHVSMLARVGIINSEEQTQIISGLKNIEEDIQRGAFQWDTSLEDLHTNIEVALVKRIGRVGKKLHTGRSRNDQIATDMRLYLLDEISLTQTLLWQFMSVLLKVAEREFSTIMPGFTHLQVAQPITFGHHIMAWFEMFYRDHQRLSDTRQRTDIMPLGSAALAGTSYPIDRNYTAKLLNFSKISHNSMDAVSDRDYVIEFCSDASLIMMHLSRCAEETILWMSQQFGFIELSDNWCTGSSIMPQKKNPDIPELVRGKTARVYGALMAILTLMKAQPLAYNRDNQEDKENLFDTVDTVKACLQAYIGLISGLKVNRKQMQLSVKRGYATATDLADYLVGKALPFRDAHAIVGEIIQHASIQGVDITELSIPELKKFSPVIEADVLVHISAESSVAARSHYGGTAPKRVLEAIKQGHQRLQDIKPD